MCVRTIINTLTDRRKKIFDKIMSRVVINHNTGCWEWQGPTSGKSRGGGGPNGNPDGTDQDGEPGKGKGKEKKERR